MESRICGIFLNRTRILSVMAAGVLLGVSQSALAAGQEPIISPEIERREIRAADIDTEDFEVGVYGGVMSVEDFGTNPVYGLRLTYHVTEDVFVAASYGRTDTSRTSYERLSGNVQLLQDSDRELSYYNLSFGLNLMPGEGFVGSSWAFSSAFYISGGVGSTSFAGDDQFTWNVGAGYRLLATDWLALHVEARDHVFDLDLLGQQQTNHNLEFTGGLSIFF